jgi:hypothetical protein
MNLQKELEPLSGAGWNESSQESHKQKLIRDVSFTITENIFDCVLERMSKAKEEVCYSGAGNERINMIPFLDKPNNVLISFCKENGMKVHNNESNTTLLKVIEDFYKMTIESEPEPEQKPEVKSSKSISGVKTEDTGIMFERAICFALDIQYDGDYKYSIDEAKSLVPRLKVIRDIYSRFHHTGRKGGRYDFTSLDDSSKHLSAKTTKKRNAKVAPQVIGQPTPEKFCEIIEIPYNTESLLKEYIQSNIQDILPKLLNYTIDMNCPIVFYTKQTNEILHICLKSILDWTQFEYTWTTPYSSWRNSSTLKIKLNDKWISLMEFQFHHTRKNMAIRWCFENLLNVLKNYDCVEIQNL